MSVQRLSLISLATRLYMGERWGDVTNHKPPFLSTSPKIRRKIVFQTHQMPVYFAGWCLLPPHPEQCTRRRPPPVLLNPIRPLREPSSFRIRPFRLRRGKPKFGKKRRERERGKERKSRKQNHRLRRNQNQQTRRRKRRTRKRQRKS